MKNKKFKGFTLIELLIVIAIIGILASIVLVSLNSARDKAEAVSFKATVSSMQAGIVMCCDDSGVVQTVDGDICFPAVGGLLPDEIGGQTISYSKHGTCDTDDVELIVTPANSVGGCTRGNVNMARAQFTCT